MAREIEYLKGAIVLFAKYGYFVYIYVCFKLSALAEVIVVNEKNLLTESLNSISLTWSKKNVYTSHSFRSMIFTAYLMEGCETDVTDVKRIW